MYDVIVVGAGISGLLSALSLSKEGKTVLVLEKEEYVGGVCRSYEVDGYFVDTGPHVITRTGAGGPLRKLMDLYFDVVPNFMPLGGYYVRLNGKLRPFPWNLKGWFNFDCISQMDRISLIKTLFGVTYLFNSGQDFSKKSVGDIVGTNFSPSTMRFLDCMSYFMTGASMAETPVARFLDAERYKSQSRNLLDKLYSILMKEGAMDQMYPRGGLNSLVTAATSSFPKGKVKVCLGEAVKHITFEDQGIKRVQTSKGEYSCETIIYSGFSADLPKCVADLPDEYKVSLEKLYTVNSLTVWLGLDKKIFKRRGSEIWVDSDPYSWVVPVSNYDSSLCPKGHQLVGFAFRPPKGCDLEAEKKRALNAIFDMVPDLESHVDMCHYQVLVPEKAAYTIDTVFANVKTPIPGLYLVGTDTERRSMGVTRASYSVLSLLAALRKDKVIR